MKVRRQVLFHLNPPFRVGQLALLLLALIVPALPRTTVAQQEIRGTTFGESVTFNISVYDLPAVHSLDDVRARVVESLERVNALMSTYVDDSDVSRFNRARDSEWIAVDAETALVVQRAVEISEKTEGGFDITVGPLVNLWNFGPGKREEFQLPEQAEIDQRMKVTGFKHLSVRVHPPAIRKAIPELQIDLSAIAKGYAVDRVAGLLRGLGCQSFMVEIGGEVWVEGTKPDGSPWNVGINDPAAALSNRTYAVAELEHLAMATSGDYRNAHWIDGKRYSHTIDPRTGKPVENNLASATVVAPDCLTADALATATMVLGSDKSLELADDWGVQLLTLTREDASEAFVQAQTASFPIKQFQTERPQFSWIVVLVSLAVFLIFVFAMSVGVIFSNRKIKGSCGGIASLQKSQGEEIACSMCSKPTEQCEELRKAMHDRASVGNSDDD